MSARRAALPIAAFALVLAAATARAGGPEPPEGFVAVFNGRDLSGWGGSLKDWSVEDGALTGKADGTLKANRFIVWKGGPVRNFELRVKVNVSPGGNSGLQYRSKERPDLGEAVVTGYQCDVVSNRPDYNGMLYEERGRRILAHAGEKVVIDADGQPWVVGSFPLLEFAPGAWHDYRVLAEGNHLRHWIDGHPTVDVIDGDPRGRALEGVLGVQVHVGPPMTIRYRDFFLKTLPDDIPDTAALIPEGARKVAPQGKDAPRTPDRPAVRAIDPDPKGGTAAAVVVDGGAALAFSEPLDAATAEDAVGAVTAFLRSVGATPDCLVRVNVAAATPEALAGFRAAYARHFGGQARAALCGVVGERPRPDRPLSVDAVAVPGAGRESRALLPPGPRVFISGQAVPGKDVASAARATLDELEATLRFLKRDRSDVVFTRAFLHPMAEADAARKAIAEFLGPDAPAPHLVAWTSGPPIEIEMVVRGGPAAAAGGSLDFLTPPGLKPSPVYSRVVRVNRGDLIFVSGLSGPEGATAAGQVDAAFVSLRTILARAGGDLRHLVKATYFVSDDACSRALNDLRPRYYDPARPPAASKAPVAGVGAPGRGLVFDMIAVRPSEGER